jgi:hypothetical protein
MIPKLLPFALYILGSLCFIAGSVVSMVQIAKASNMEASE